jgi:diguanylate cyclase (GGDEF)-like protein/PAS domain S-box-containing protein
MHERSALYSLLADNTTYIILKTDRRGFILNASPAIAALGVTLPAMLIGPHIRDLAHPGHSATIEAEHHAAIAGRGTGRWVEFAGAPELGGDHWFEIQLRPLADRSGQAYGTLAVMRCIDARKSLEDRLFAAELTDPLTRLTNRIAFVSMLDHLVDRPDGGCLALFDIDHFMTLNMRFGQATGDELLCVFAELLRSMTRSEDIISRIDGERFGVLMPALVTIEAAELCQPVVDTLAELGGQSPDKDFAVTTSVGIAPIGKSTDSTLKRAELALFLAKAKGRSRIEVESGEQCLLDRRTERRRS